MAEPRVSSIPPGADFIPTLVEHLLEGRLVPGFTPLDDPLALANATIWVPTRRAVRTLTATFVKNFDGRATLLPRILALGDAEDDDPFAATGFAGSQTPKPVLDGIERRLLLTRLIFAWTRSLKPEQHALFDGNEIVVPATLADAVGMADQLGTLMDSVATEEADWSKLVDLVPDDLQEWWQLTLRFLAIATETWPAILAERGLADGAQERAAALRHQAELYATRGAKGPVIAAGSTGSIPATAALLKAVAHLPNGVVVLPGLDRDLDDETWAKVDLPDNPRDDTGTAPAHPQFGLRRLLEAIGIARDQVAHLGIANDDPGVLRVRERIVSEALRPADSTDRWHTVMEAISEDQRAAALAGIALVEAPGEREEALAIALALRETLERADATAALVTPDRNLARRVAVEMRRFGVTVDDSAGLPLHNRSAGIVARLVVRQAFGSADPSNIVALLKHPLACFGIEAAVARQAAQAFELAGLRGALEPIGNGQFLDGLHTALGERNKERPRLRPAVLRFCDADWDGAKRLAEKLDTLFPDDTASGETASVGAWAQRSRDLIAACVCTTDDSLDYVSERASWQALQDFLAELEEQTDSLPVTGAEWPDVFEALMQDRPVRFTGGLHPRVTILGPLEVRLQSYDRIVLGGLNEKTWPGAGRSDPFLSRPMKTALGLPTPERRTGLAAHDFSQLLGMGDVVLTRAKRADNAPTVASRWVQRLETVAGSSAAAAMALRGRKFLDWATALDAPTGDVKSASQPKPTPPVDVRPQQLSVTQIATWIADPYAIYARKILKLEALAPLVREADHRERGTLFHKAVETYVALPAHKRTLKDLLYAGDVEFKVNIVPNAVLVRWWPRFEQAASAFAAWDAEYGAGIEKIVAEPWGETQDGLDGFTLTGKADRFDMAHDGTLVLWDYKTTSGPSAAAVRRLAAPQLPLLAEMARRGAFEELTGPVDALGYIRLLGGGDFKAEVAAGPDAKTRNPTQEITDAGALAGASWGKLAKLVVAYRSQDKPYISKARYLEDQPYASDYDHLARVAEWSVAAGDDNDDGAER